MNEGKKVQIFYRPFLECFRGQHSQIFKLSKVGMESLQFFFAINFL